MNNLLRKIQTLKILVVGDCMLDHYIFGDVYRISPEAPVPVVNIEHETYRLGGACNVAANLKQLGAQVKLVGWIGDDKAGLQIQTLLKDQIEFPQSCVDAAVETIVKTRVIVRNQQLCRLDKEASLSMDDTVINRLLTETTQDVAGVIISDYGKGCIQPSVLEHLVRLKNERRFFLAVDPKPGRGLIYKGVDLLTPNRQEALQLASIDSKFSKTFLQKELVERIQAVHSTRYLAITLGEEGIFIVEPTGRTEIYPTLSHEVFDVSGAGDTAIAALTLALCAGADVPQAAYFSNLAAGIVVGKVGTATVSAQELLTYANSNIQ